MNLITSLEQLEAIYGTADGTGGIEAMSVITPPYRAIIEASPFVTLATCGPEGLDCSPRGDDPGFVRVAGDRTLMLPERQGHDRVDSLRNIVCDSRVALLFLIPGSSDTLRVNGSAWLSNDPAVLDSFAVDDEAPRCVIVIEVRAAYFRTARAVVRADLWNPDNRADPKTLAAPVRTA